MSLLKRILLIADGPGVMTHTARLVTLLLAQGVTVRVALTESARLLVGDYYTTMLSGNPLVSFPAVPEKVLADSDAVMVAPASETLVKTLCQQPEWQTRWESLARPVIIVPGLLPQDDKGETWDELRQQGNDNVRVMDAAGEQTDMGALGRLCVASPERCLEAAMTALSGQKLSGVKVLITAGPTAEDADPVRYVTNRSTGRMGVALARMAAWQGAEVTLVHGPMSWPVPPHENIHACPVRSAQDMYESVMSQAEAQDLAILCAAVADYTPVDYSDIKIKKGHEATFALLLKRTPDILDAVGHMAGRRPYLVGFAAESDHVRENAQMKLLSKNCDMLCANDVTKPGSGFAVGTNQVIVFKRGGEVVELPQMSKEEVARKILEIAEGDMRKTVS